MFKAQPSCLLFFCAFLCSVGGVSAEETPSTLEFRLAEDGAVSGWQKMELPGSEKPIFVSPKASLTGGHIEKVSFYDDAAGKPSIGLTLTEEGAKAMESVTSENLDKRLAIVLKGKVVSAPVIRSKISRDVQITGNLSKADLLEFFHAIVLRESP